MEEEVKTKNNKLKWYIVKSTSGKEKSVAGLLEQRVKANDLTNRISEIVVPTQEKIVIKRGKKQTVQERIFPGYILVQMEVSDETLHLVRNTEGVQGFVGYSEVNKKPKPLNEKEVEGILAFTRVKQSPVFEASFMDGDAVKVVDGPFKDFVGTVKEVNPAKGQVSVLLSIFGRETPVQLDFLQVNKI